MSFESKGLGHGNRLTRELRTSVGIRGSDSLRNGGSWTSAQSFGSVLDTERALPYNGSSGGYRRIRAETGGQGSVSESRVFSLNG